LRSSDLIRKLGLASAKIITGIKIIIILFKMFYIHMILIIYYSQFFESLSWHLDAGGDVKLLDVEMAVGRWW
jgi:hypothetical protein